ncbi:hypothetical protein [Algoriphagus sp. A40]|uniref:hypothetical protein n=1 Tax=Algoriphagus sp. A40 TaxID=1945863 RepID=UPI001115A542|nr:hypothetical protein [Algoriphagus sp. A40]
MAENQIIDTSGWFRAFPVTTSQQHLAENLGALAVKFTVAELKEIRAEIEKFKLLGTRTPECTLVDQ